ncbi:MAG: diacylglycerol/lipid kinase family protein [Stackebrandtia sp.]
MVSWVGVLGNPRSSRRRRVAYAQVMHSVASAGVDIRELAARSSAEAEALCSHAVQAGAGAIVAVGGDGTVHRAVQALATTGVPLGIVPVGSGNDLAAALGVGPDVGSAVSDVVAALCRGDFKSESTAQKQAVARETPLRSMDLLRVADADGQTRWCATVLAAGLDALIANRANRLHLGGGWLRYQLAIAVEMLRLRRRAYRLDVDGTQRAFDGVLLAVGNTYRYGAGARICPDADPDDGLLDVTYGGRLGRLAVARLRARVYRGTHLSHPKVHGLRGSRVRITGPSLTTYADGEPCLRLPVDVVCVPGALRLLTGDPRSGSA